jgi:hypothetical protein
MRSILSCASGVIVAALLAVACANGSDSSTDDGTSAAPGDGSGAATNDDAATGSPSNGGYDSGASAYDSAPADDGASASNDSAIPDSGAVPADSAPAQDSGTVNTPACDMSQTKYQIEYTAAGFQSNPPMCASGCTASQCCALIFCVAL